MLTHDLTRLHSRASHSSKPGYARFLAAVLVHGASRSLARVARQLLHVGQAAARAEPVYEFYAEAGAPEGALYVDGQLVGHLSGVTRL